jgi:E3 ubiquitin-protein ligase TRIP12
LMDQTVYFYEKSELFTNFICIFCNLPFQSLIFCHIFQFSESPLSSWSTPQAAQSTHHLTSGRSWTVAGTSLANMFPEQLRVAKRRDNDNEESGATPTSSHHHSSPTAPMRLSDMLKRKRVSKRSTNNSRKGRNSIGSSEETSSQSAAAAAAAGFDMPQLVHPPQTHESSSTPSRRSKLADRTSSLLSQLHPGRWVRSHHDNNSPMSGSGSGSSSSHHRKDNSSPTLSSSNANSGSAKTAILTNPATMAHSREKAKRWVREQASRFLESYFKESLGSRHPALTILRRLSAQVDHLTRKPKDGERSLKEILSILYENDISPFEVTQSGLVPALLTYLTKSNGTTTTDPDEIPREIRLRTFLHVFLGCPKMNSQNSLNENSGK